MLFPFTSDDIKRLLRCTDDNIVKYSDLDDDYTNLNELFHGKQFVIILIEYEFRKGHWVSIYRQSPTKFVYFNSFGDPFDYYITELSKKLNRQLGNEYGAIKSLLDNTRNATMEWNKIKYQDDLSDTCGGWVVLFVRLMEKYHTLSKVQKELQYVTDYKLTNLLTNSSPTSC